MSKRRGLIKSQSGYSSPNWGSFDPPVTYEKVRCLRTSPKAILVLQPETNLQDWFPKKCIKKTDLPTASPGGGPKLGFLTVPAWLAKKKALKQSYRGMPLSELD